MSYRFIPQLDDADIRRQQEEGLANTLARVWNSPQYGSKLRACGLKPGDQLGLDDLARLPTVDVDDLRVARRRLFVRRVRRGGVAGGDDEGGGSDKQGGRCAVQECIHGNLLGEVAEGPWAFRRGSGGQNQKRTPATQRESRVPSPASR